MEDHQHLPTDLRWDLFRESPEIVGIDISVPVNLSTGSDHRLLPLIELDTSIGRTPDLFQEASLGPISIEVRQSPVPAHRRDEPARVSRLDERSNSELGELGKKPVIAVPCTSPSSTGQLVFDTNMLAAKSRKLRKKTKAELEASRMLRKSGGACLKHKAARKAVIYNIDHYTFEKCRLIAMVSVVALPRKPVLLVL